MQDSLIEVINSFLAFVQEHQSRDWMDPSNFVTSEQFEKLRVLDMELYAECQAHGLEFPAFPGPPDETYRLFAHYF